MEKFGVEEKTDDTKTAEKDPRCPKCGEPVEKHGDVKICPEHGSEPFEEDEKEEK